MQGKELEQWARSVVVEACRRELKRPITLEEVQAVQTIGRLESTYGRGWSTSRNGPGSEESKNWGAVQYIKGQATDIVLGSFVTKDSHRDGTVYSFPYCTYSTDVAGCRHVVRLLERMGALKAARETRHIRAVSLALGRCGYYEGSGATASEAYWNHFQACLRNLKIIVAGCGDADGKGLDYDDSEAPQSGCTYVDEDDQDEGSFSEKASEGGGEGAREPGQESPEAPAGSNEEAEDLTTSVIRDTTPAPAAGPSALDTPDPAPVLAAPSKARKLAPAAVVVAIVTTLAAAWQCQGCSPVQRASAHNLIGVVADWGPELCQYLEDEAERAACRLAARVLEQVEALTEEPGMGGAGGAGGARAK